MTEPDINAVRVALRDGRLPASKVIPRSTELRLAAVAVCFGSRRGRACLVITRRSPKLRSHPGQWALPGGRVEPGERVVDGARRELVEETGIDLPDNAVIGCLDGYSTRSGYIMMPVVVDAGSLDTVDFKPNDEATELHFVPLADFDTRPRFITIPESAAPVIQLPLFGRWIHAPAAAIIYQFCELALHGRRTPVAHFEQPVFAWK